VSLHGERERRSRTACLQCDDCKKESAAVTSLHCCKKKNYKGADACVSFTI